ncbi:hypothetical protein BH23CHL6_BH23CHL6_13270 [soil metagenome]
MVRNLRRLSVGAALVLAIGALFTQSVVLPARVVACSCAGPPPPLAEIVRENQAQVAIVAGTVGAALPERTPVAVDSWFHGANPTNVVWLAGGTQMMSSCDITMSPGERRLFVLYAQGDGVYSANMCSPGGLIGAPDGDALMLEAASTFGGQPPPSAEPEAPPAAEPSPWLGDGLLWVLAAVGVAALLFGAIILVGLRQARR